MNEETVRADFEQFMGDDGKWPQAIERCWAGNYILSQSASSWRVWRSAYHQCLQSTEIQALRKDAERYRATRAGLVGTDPDYGSRFCKYCDAMGIDQAESITEEQFDAATDAAMEQNA